MSHSRPETALRRLKQMRLRRRRLRAWTGFYRWLFLLGGLGWFSFLLDYFLSLPTEVRGIYLLFATVLLAIGVKVFLLVARTPISEDELANEIESAAGDLEQSLITSIQLTRPDNPHRQFYSPMLLDRTIAEAEEKMAHLAPGALLSRLRVWRAFWLAALVLGPIGLGAVFEPVLTKTYVARNLLLEEIDWPRTYFLRIEQPSSKDTLLAVGDSLTVSAIRERGGGARARIEAYFKTAEDLETREELTLERRGDDQFRRVFANVSRDFRFRIHCGDFTSSWYQVGVRSRPRIEQMTLSFEYPEYTGLNDSGAPLTLDGGHLKVAAGTVVTFAARTSIPIREASRIETRRAGDGESKTEEPVTISGGGSELSGQFTVEENGLYFFRLVSEDGFENPSPIRYRIAVINDQAPLVQVVSPGRNLELTPRALLKLEIHLEDDYGITSAETVIHLEGELGSTGEPFRRVALASVEEGTRETDTEVSLDLSEWSVQPGTRLEYRVTAVDAIGQQGESRSWVLTIVDEKEMKRIVEDIVTIMSERLQETYELERDTRRELEDLREQAQDSGGELPETAQPNLRHARMSQERVNSRIEEGVERFQELTERVLQNRLSDYQDLPLIEDLRERLDDLVQNEGQQSLEAIDQLSDQVDDQKITPEQIDDAVSLLRSTERKLKALVEELEEWGDVQTMIRKLEDLLKTERELEELIQGRVRESLGGDSEQNKDD